MNEFDYEVMQRKRIANQAKYRKRGSKSKKCSLPSDGMSQKQWKERNGEIVSYNLNKPMSWEQFKALPNDVKLQYVNKLQIEYNASLSAISKMLGMTASTVYRHFKDCGIIYGDSSCRPKFSKAQKEEWERFCNSETEQESTPPEAAGDIELPDDILASTNPTADSFEAQEAAEPPRKPGMMLDSFTLQFSGGFDPDAIRNSLAMILQKGQQVRIEINCKKEG